MGEIGVVEQLVEQPFAGEGLAVVDGPRGLQQGADIVLGGAQVRHLLGQAE